MFSFCFYPSLRAFISNFLSDRIIVAVFDNHCSSPRVVNSSHTDSVYYLRDTLHSMVAFVFDDSHQHFLFAVNIRKISKHRSY